MSTKLHCNAANSLTWYLKYVGGPVVVGLTMCKLFDCFRRDKKDDLFGKVPISLYCITSTYSQNCRC